MPNTTVRAASPALPEETSPPLAALSAEVQALAAAFEAAWEEEFSSDYDGAGYDRTCALARQIIALPATGFLIMRLKARVFIWSDGMRPENFPAGADRGDVGFDALASLFRELGADYPIGREPPSVESGRQQ
jgi:hypothetical protein